MTLERTCMRTVFVDPAWQRWLGRTMLAGALGVLLVPGTGGADPVKPVSYSRDLVPILKRSCNGCHHPGKKKGDLDLTTFSTLQKGGKHGPVIQPGHPAQSRLIEEVSGEEPNMPMEGAPLSQAEVALFVRWIAEGASDDTPAASPAPRPPPTYSIAPVISALAYSPDGGLLAVSGYHEVLLHKADGSMIEARLAGDSPRIESIAFSPDGERLAVSGGAPAQFGEIQIWDVPSRSLLKACRISTDSLYGVSFSPDGERVAFGCADKTARVIRIEDGQETLRLDNHTDWVLDTTFTVDGKRLLTGSRDRAMKLIDATTGQLIDDINKLIEGVLCLARHPRLDQVAYGGDLGGLRLYRMSDNQQRTAANNDVNMLREFERQPAPVGAIAFSPKGDLIAAGGSFPEVRLYRTSDGSRAAVLKGHRGAIFSLTFHPTQDQIAAGGYDGVVRVFTSAGQLVGSFSPVPITVAAASAR